MTIKMQISIKTDKAYPTPAKLIILTPHKEDWHYILESRISLTYTAQLAYYVKEKIWTNGFIRSFIVLKKLVHKRISNPE